MNTIRKSVAGAAVLGATLTGGAFGAAFLGGSANAQSTDSTETTIAAATTDTTVAASTDTTVAASTDTTVAASTDTTVAASTASNTDRAPRDPSKGGHQANGKTEELLTGDVAAKVTAAAQAAVPGGTIERVESDAEGDPYEAHVVKADGSQVTVKVGSDFLVIRVESGGGPAASAAA
jgi:hypothetical protein